MSHSYNRKAFKALHDQVILDTLESINTSHSLAIAISYRYKDDSWKDLVRFRHPVNFLNAEDYRLYLQANALLSKSLTVASVSDELHLRESSLNSFFKVEEEVKEWNKTLTVREFHRDSLLNQAAILIERIIGFVPPTFDMHEPIYTTGSTASLSGFSASIVGKIQSEIDVSPLCLPYLVNWARREPLISLHLKKYSYKVQGHSVMEMVPKDFEKKRIICKEPLFNMAIQRYYSKFLKGKLRKVGIKIEAQADFHKQLLRGDSSLFATIDQSDASDRISQSLVKRLLPPEWYTLLDRLRSRSVKLPTGEVHVLEKFMTQGNGFTFELETLLFWAIGKAALLLAGKNPFLSVFGDDMLCYDHCADTIMLALTSVGLKVNYVKSYTDSRFKESCGTDTFDGFEVRPIYLKEFSDGVYGYFELYNRIREIARASCSGICTDVGYKRACNRILHAISVEHRLYGPPLYGDAVLQTYEYDKYSRKGKRIRVLSARGFKGSAAGRFKPGPADCYTATMIYGLLGYDSQGTLVRGAPRISSPKYVHMSEYSRSIEWL